MTERGDSYIAGTKLGGLRAAAKNKLMHGPDFYKRIGAIGGTKAPGPFKANKELARRAGALGGRRSRRTGIKNKEI